MLKDQLFSATNMTSVQVFKHLNSSEDNKCQRNIYSLVYRDFPGPCSAIIQIHLLRALKLCVVAFSPPPPPRKMIGSENRKIAESKD